MNIREEKARIRRRILYSVECPTCGSEIGLPCVRKDKLNFTITHTARIKAFKDMYEVEKLVNEKFAAMGGR